MLSHGLIAVPHFGQADAGSTIDFRSGIRTMHTFRKLPITRPTRAANTPISAGEATYEFCHINAAERPSPCAVVLQPLTRRGFMQLTQSRWGAVGLRCGDFPRSVAATRFDRG